jgi:SAM-dependent methyltransferase
MRPGTLLRYYACKDQLEKVIKDKDVVLDIGCYDGFILSKLKEKKDFTPIVLDLDEKGLKIAKQNGLGGILASGTQIPLKSRSVDVLMLLDVVEHIKRDNLLITEASKVLKKGGILILTTPIKGKKLVPFINMKKLHKSWGHAKEGYSYGELKMLFDNNNFKILESTTYFNLLSRYAYFIIFYLPSPLFYKLKILFYSLILRTETRIKFGAMGFFIICQRELWQ